MKVSICKLRMAKTREENKPIVIIGLVPDSFIIMNSVFLNGVIECPHEKTEFIDWPDGSGVEICTCCCMSRNIWEQGQTNWIMLMILTKQKKKYNHQLIKF